jgi:hypothetical protein
MNNEFEDENESLRDKFIITAIQVFGLAFGYTIMAILSVYDEDIHV